MSRPPPVPKSVVQSGEVTPGHQVVWTTDGVVADGGPGVGLTDPYPFPGQVFIGTQAFIDPVVLGTGMMTIAANGNSDWDEILLGYSNGSAATGAAIAGLGSRGNQQSRAAVQLGDLLYVVVPFGDDGTDFVTAGQLDFEVDPNGTVGPGVVPTAIRIKLANSAGALFDAFYIDRNGKVGLGTALPTARMEIAAGPSDTTLTILTNQFPSGSVSAINTGAAPGDVYTLNEIQIQQENIAASGAVRQVNGFTINHVVQGTSVKGDRHSFGVSSTFAPPDDPTNTSSGVTAGQFIAQSFADNGGGGAGSGRGSLWGVNASANLIAAASNWSICAGGEINLNVTGTSSVDNKLGWYVILPSSDAVQGRSNDFAFGFMNNGTSGGFKQGFVASDLFTGKTPLSSGATFIGTNFTGGPYTITNGVDLTGFTFTGSAFKSAGFTIGPAGTQLLGPAMATKTNDYVFADGDRTIIFNKGSSAQATLPAAASYKGRQLTIITIQNQTVVSATSNVVPLAGGGASTAILAGTAGKWADLESDGTDWVIIRAN